MKNALINSLTLQFQP